MGHHFAGFVIDKSYKGKTEEFEAELGYEINNPTEVDYEDAFLGNTPQGFSDVYFGEKGTIIFTDYENVIDGSMDLSDAKVLSFATNETSMIYYFELTDHGQLVRNFINFNLEITSEEGSRLPYEDDENPYDTIIQTIDELIGENVADEELKTVWRISDN